MISGINDYIKFFFVFMAYMLVTVSYFTESICDEGFKNVLKIAIYTHKKTWRMNPKRNLLLQGAF